MLDFILVCGFESYIEHERNHYDAYVIEYARKVITVRCIQSSKNSRGGWVTWIWDKTDSGNLKSISKMKGIVTCTSDLPIVIRETKKYIDARF